jgi:hypothetical protein
MQKPFLKLGDSIGVHVSFAFTQRLHANGITQALEQLMMPIATSAIGEVSKNASPTIIIDGMACIRNCVIAPYSSGYPSGCVSALRQQRLENRAS